MIKIVLDASAILNSIGFYENAELLTISEVIEEIKNSKSSSELALALELEKINIVVPKKEFIEKIEKEAKKTNDTLSETDVKLLALSYELSALDMKSPQPFANSEVAIATDDYGIQNLAKKLKIKFIPVFEQGIKKVIEWQFYCPACKKKAENYGKCEVCGSRIKRKPKTRVAHS